LIYLIHQSAHHFIEQLDLILRESRSPSREQVCDTTQRLDSLVDALPGYRLVQRVE
jgi:hypothetical protein